MRKSKKSNIALVSASMKSKEQLTLGYLSIFLSIICFSTVLVARPLELEGIILASAFLLIGIVLLFLAYRTKRMISQFRLYVSILSNQSSMAIYEISQKAGIPEQRIMRELQAMIDRCFFVDAYIDKWRKYIVFPQLEQAEKESVVREGEYEVITCSVCGGSNQVIKKKNCNCMYCDNKLKTKFSLRDIFH